MFAEWIAHLTLRWIVGEVAPKVALLTLLAAENVAPRESKAMILIASPLEDYRAEGNTLSFIDALRLFAIAAGTAIGAIYKTVNAAVGTLAFGWLTAWAVLWYPAHVSVVMKAKGGYTAAAWIYLFPVLGLLIFSVALVCITQVRWTRLTWKRKGRWRLTLMSPYSGREAVTRGFGMLGGVTALSIFRTLLERPCAMPLYGMLGVLLAVFCLGPLGTRLFFLSVSLGAASGATTLLLLRTHREVAAWAATMVLIAAVARVSGAAHRRVSVYA